MTIDSYTELLPFKQRSNRLAGAGHICVCLRKLSPNQADSRPVFGKGNRTLRTALAGKIGWVIGCSFRAGGQWMSGEGTKHLHRALVAGRYHHRHSEHLFEKRLQLLSSLDDAWRRKNE